MTYYARHRLSLIQIGIGLLLTFLVAQLGFYTERSHFSKLFALYAIFFSFYLGICYVVKSPKSILFFTGLSILLRLLLVFAFPALSDDIYRFIWDGRLLVQGINPFDHLPSYYIDNRLEIANINQTLYKQLNSPDYFTVYPPVNQFVFAVAAWLSPNSLWGGSMIMKSFLLFFEIGNILLIINLLKYFQLPAKNVLLYALNPLIILEVTGNIHFEGAMVFFFLLGIWLLIKMPVSNPKQLNPPLSFFIGSAISMALSIASKLLPLMFLPFFIKRIGKVRKRFAASQSVNLNWKRVYSYFLIIGLTLLLLFLPLTNGLFLSNFGNSLYLYFQKFEFNASLYYLFRWLGFRLKGYNLIAVLGPILAALVFIGISLKAFFEQNPSWVNIFEQLLFSICLYLFCATTVHPWYIALPVVFSVFTRFRFPVLWSGLVFMTYINYSYEPYFENLWVVGMEYIIVAGFLIYEMRLVCSKEAAG